MFVFDSFLYFRCEDHARAGLDLGPQFLSLDHATAGSGLTRGHGFAPWTTLPATSA